MEMELVLRLGWIHSVGALAKEPDILFLPGNSYLPRRSLDFEEIFQVFELLQWFPIICIQVEIYTVMGHCHDYWAEPNRESVSYRNGKMYEIQYDSI